MDRAAFFASIRKSPFGGKLATGQVAGIEAILRACERQSIVDTNWVANILAQCHHETGGAMLPVTESLTYSSAARIRKVWPKRFPSEASAAPFVRNAKGLALHVYGDRADLGNRPGTEDGWVFRGRGHIQITGRGHFLRFGELLGIDLAGTPALALDLTHSANIAVIGMARGLFTGRSLADFFSASRNDPRGARAIVNGDVGVNGPKIASLHAAYLTAIEAGGGWSISAASVVVATPAPVPRPTSLLGRLFG